MQRTPQNCAELPLSFSNDRPSNTIFPILKDDFFIKQSDKISALLDELSADVILLGKEGATPNYILRMKVEIANLKKIINRIAIIKTTDFIPFVFLL